MNTVTLLVRGGASVNQATTDGDTPLMLAAESGRTNIVEYLMSECDALVNQPDMNGYTPLSAASEQGHLVIVKLLVKGGAKVNQVANDGFTPLLIAAKNGQTSVARWLIKHGGADPSVKVESVTAAQIAKHHGHHDLARRLQCANPGCAHAGMKMCSGCMTTRYCSSECQRAHWKVHKVDCVKVQQDMDEKTE